MSRHELAPLDPSKVAMVVAGWDQPLMTFFVQVYRADAPDDEDEISLWRGTAPHELSEVDQALAIARLHAVVPPDLGARLYGDRDVGR